MHRRGNPQGIFAYAVKLSGKRTEARRKRRILATFLQRLFFCAVMSTVNPNDPASGSAIVMGETAKSRRL